jgi:ABC-type nickel/cobalt efflux system permease component RcnA
MWYLIRRPRRAKAEERSEAEHTETSEVKTTTQISSPTRSFNLMSEIPEMPARPEAKAGPVTINLNLGDAKNLDSHDHSNAGHDHPSKLSRIKTTAIRVGIAVGALACAGIIWRMTTAANNSLSPYAQEILGPVPQQTSK